MRKVPYSKFEHLKQKAMKHDLTKDEQDELIELMKKQPTTITEKTDSDIEFTYVNHPFWNHPLKVRR